MKHQLQRYLVYFNNVRIKIGLMGAVKYALKRLLSRKLTPSSMAMKPNPVEFYNFIYAVPFGETLTDEDNSVINWVIPDFGIGSGGHLNIFRVVKKLEEKGFVCRINIDGPTNFTSGEDARNCIRKHFFPIQAEVTIGRDALSPAAATFATSWITAYTVRDYLGAGKRYYFVQDFEPFFYAQGGDYVFAEETYKFGFKGVTAGNWLAEKLAREYAMETTPFKFSYDRELYKPFPRREPEISRIFYYARPVTARRGFELGLLTLAKVYEKNPNVEFILAGWDISGYEIPFPYLNAGVLAIDELPDLYSQCDVALVLSLTNVSLLPMEVMACGCAVVSNLGQNVQWLLDDKVTKFAESTPEALSDAIVDLLEDSETLEALKKEGMKFVEKSNWDDEVQKIATTIERDLS